jgi:hypothetical protein
MRAWPLLVALALVACSHKEGGMRLSLRGEPMVTTGRPVAASRADMRIVGSTDDRRAVYARRGGGGGGGRETLYVAVGPGRYMAIVPDHPMGR